MSKAKLVEENERINLKLKNAEALNQEDFTLLLITSLVNEIKTKNED